MTIDEANELADEHYLTLEEVLDYCGGRSNIEEVNAEDIIDSILLGKLFNV